MARVLVCVDPVPASDGSCAATAWIEQPSVADFLPTVDDANAVGMVFFASLAIIAAMVLLVPSKETDV